MDPKTKYNLISDYLYSLERYGIIWTESFICPNFLDKRENRAKRLRLMYVIRNTC